MAKIRRDDTVIVLTGRDRGKTGKVREVRPTQQRVVIEGINIVKKHSKPRGSARRGGIIDQEAPIHVSNVALICDKCGTTRVGFRLDPDGKKVKDGNGRPERICKKCGQPIG